MNQLPNKPPAKSVTNYPASAKFFHWVTALIILCNLISGTILVNFDAFSQQINLLIIHEQCGVMILMLTILRLIWRITHRYPNLNGEITSHEILLAKFGHLLLYILMLAIPIYGVLLSQSVGHQPGFLWFRLPKFISQNLDFSSQLLNIHKNLAILITIIIVAHTIAALKHHFIDKNQVLTRILPWKKVK